jgi:putative addiction module killer protein
MKIVGTLEVRLYRTESGLVPFRQWIESISDVKTRNVVNARIVRLESGNLGTYRDLKQGLFELKIDYGPGMRVYFMRDGNALVILLSGGDKSSQFRDIAKARRYLYDYKKRQTK